MRSLHWPRGRERLASAAFESQASTGCCVPHPHSVNDPMTDPALDGEILGGRHHQRVRVYYEDTDFTGIVYHANYLRYMERGRTNYLRLIGADHRALFEETEREAPGFAFVVRSMNIDFLKPARMDDILDVIT